MKYIYIFIISIFSTGCFSDDASDLTFTDEFKTFIDPYKKDDVINFKSSTGDVHTLKISAIESYENNGGFITYPLKTKTIRVKHLPENLWTGETVISTGSGSDEIEKYDQRFIYLSSREPSETRNQNSLSLKYRDFSISFDDVPALETGTLLKDYDISNYWRFESKYPSKDQTDTSVIEVIWTKKYGLTAYYLKNNDFYIIDSSQ